MTVYRPEFQPQNPAINGYSLGWQSCTAYSMAMLVERSTIGERTPTGAAIRRKTGDTVGGTTLNQCALAAKQLYPHDDRVQSIVVRVGANTITPSSAAEQMKKGRGFCLQGNTSALIGTPWQSTNGPVNHCWHVNEGRGYDGDIPEDALVYDPAADGRRNMDQGPSWIPWSRVLAFAAALRPWGDNDPRKLGPGKFYAAFGPDTEPHVILYPGAVKSDPFPDKMRAGRDNCPVFASPTAGAKVVRRIPAEGDVFWGYQRIMGQHWYGDQDGNEWVRGADVRHEGGVT